MLPLEEAQDLELTNLLNSLDFPLERIDHYTELALLHPGIPLLKAYTMHRPR